MLDKSAGGLVVKQVRNALKILMIRVENLEKETVWTFPKGHLEKKESDEEAALREVEEETGWKCAIEKMGKEKYFKKVRYDFHWNGALVKKEVVWFLMKPILKTGDKDVEEVLEARWFDLREAGKKITYGSDKKLLTKLKGCSRRLQRSSAPQSSGIPRYKEKPPR